MLKIVFPPEPARRCFFYLAGFFYSIFLNVVVYIIGDK